MIDLGFEFRQPSFRVHMFSHNAASQGEKWAQSQEGRGGSQVNTEKIAAMGDEGRKQIMQRIGLSWVEEPRGEEEVETRPEAGAPDNSGLLAARLVYRFPWQLPSNNLLLHSSVILWKVFPTLCHYHSSQPTEAGWRLLPQDRLCWRRRNGLRPFHDDDGGGKFERGDQRKNKEGLKTSQV